MIISLGNNCSVQLSIRKLQSYYNGIFSWCKSLNIDNVIKCIENDFDGLNNINNYNKNKVNTKYLFIYPHNPINNSFIESLNRRIDRFNNLDTDTLFVRTEKIIHFTKINKLYNVIANKHINKNIQIKLLVISHKFINDEELNNNIIIQNIPLVCFNKKGEVRPTKQNLSILRNIIQKYQKILNI